MRSNIQHTAEYKVVHKGNRQVFVIISSTIDRLSVFKYNVVIFYKIL